MLPLLVATLIAVGGLAKLLVQWKQRRGSCEFVVGVLPFALLILALPIAPATLHVVRSFQEIARTGSGGVATVGPMLIEVTGMRLIETLVFVIVMAGAMALQAWAELSDADRVTEDQPNEGPAQGKRARMLMGTVLLVIPVAVLVHFAHGTSTLVMGPALDYATAADGAGRQIGTDRNLQQFSATISSRLMGAFAAGVAMTGTLLTGGLLNLWALRSKSPRWLSRVSWILVAAVMLAAGWHALQLAADIRAFSARVAATK